MMTKSGITWVKSTQTSAPKTVLDQRFLYEIYFYYLMNGLASAFFGADVCTDFTSVNPTIG
jgi:hypothetical protein